MSDSEIIKRLDRIIELLEKQIEHAAAPPDMSVIENIADTILAKGAQEKARIEWEMSQKSGKPS